MSRDNCQTFLTHYTVVITLIPKRYQNDNFLSPSQLFTALVYIHVVITNSPLSLTYGADELWWRVALCNPTSLTHPVSTSRAVCPTVKHPAQLNFTGAALW